MAEEKKSRLMITINLTDDTKIAAMRTVLGYEAGRRGLSMSQTFADMVLEAVNIEEYPEEMRGALEEIDRQRVERAARVTLESAKKLRRSA